jgi:hypothetical protein
MSNFSGKKSPVTLGRWVAKNVIILNVCLFLTACAGTGESVPVKAAQPATVAGEQKGIAARELAVWGGKGKWGKFHSKRFGLWLPLPNGSTWKINDHRTSWLEAIHEPSASVLRLRMYLLPKLVSVNECAAMVREQNPSLPAERREWVLAHKRGSIPPGFQGRGVVLVQPSEKEPGVVLGHYVLFGVAARKCFALHFQTTAAGSNAERLLGDRLGDVAELLTPRIQVDEIVDVPRKNPMEELNGNR